MYLVRSIVSKNQLNQKLKLVTEIMTNNIHYWNIFYMLYILYDSFKQKPFRLEMRMHRNLQVSFILNAYNST